MARTIIDMTKDPRGGQFEYFRTMTDPWAGITVPVDITDLLASLNSRPFFLSYLYAVMRAANAVPELRLRLLSDGQVVEYDHCDPSYTVMKPDGTGVYVYCLLEDDLSSYEKFVAEGKRRQKETLERGTLTEDGDVLSNFFVSCVPWLSYTQIKEPAGGADDSDGVRFVRVRHTGRHRILDLFEAAAPLGRGVHHLFDIIGARLLAHILAQRVVDLFIFAFRQLRHDGKSRARDLVLVHAVGQLVSAAAGQNHQQHRSQCEKPHFFAHIYPFPKK